MAQTIQKVVSGQPFAMPASTFNAFADAAIAHKLSTETGAAPLGSSRQLSTVVVRNNTASPRARFESLGLDGLAIAETDNPAQFARQPVLEGVAGQLEHAGRMVVLLEPVEPGRLATAVVSGVIPAMVRMVGERQRFADVDPSRPGMLRTWLRGSAELLWVQPVEDRADPEVALVLARVGAAGTAMRMVITETISISANRWAYAWAEADWNGSKWVEVSGGATSDEWGLAYNGIENSNTASGKQGSGVNVDNFPGTFSIVPLNSGASVEISGPVFGPDGAPSWHFDAVNAEDGECSP